MSKRLFVFVDNTEKSSAVLKFIVKNNISHNLITEINAVEKLKKAINFEPPILLCYDDETEEYSILENKKHLMEFKNGS
jgi:hypothetical protein